MEEREKRRKRINGVDAKDRRMRISTITVPRRVIHNDKQMKNHVLPFKRERQYLVGKRKIDELKGDIDRSIGYTENREENYL